MGSGKLRVLACRGVAALGVTMLAAACGTVSAAPIVPGAGQAAAATATAPAPVPVLGALALGPFSASIAGTKALALCQQWAGLRGGYAARIQQDTPYQLEQWFSGVAWRLAFRADSPLRTGVAYIAVNTAFGLASTAAAASLDNARLLDQACAAAD